MAERNSNILTLFILVSLIIIKTTSDCYAQEIPKDTSYTVWSTYKKLIKQYPEIVSVKPLTEIKSIKQQYDVVYTSLTRDSQTRDLHADLFYPEKIRKNIPAVILVYGGGWRSGDKSMNKPLAQQLAMRGYFVMSVEYQLSLEAKYPAAVYNLKAAVRSLRARAKTLNINENKIAIIGGSAGGQLASLIGATNEQAAFEGDHGYPKFSSSVQAVVDLDGVLDFTDPESLALKRDSYSADVFWLEGSYDTIPQKWKSASPVYNVTSKSAPILFINSSQTRFHAGCKTMIDKLSAFNISSEVVDLKGAPHSYWFFEPWFTPMTNNIVDFLDRKLKSKK